MMPTQGSIEAPAAFAFRAARPDGGIERGIVEARDRREALELLARRELWPLELHARTPRPALAARSAMSAGDLALGLRLLADMLDAGIPLARALESLHELGAPGWSALLPALQAGIREGRSLGDALAAAPVRVHDVVVALLVAGEAGSALAPAVRRAAELMDDVVAARAALFAALAYPVVLLVGGGSAFALLVGVVLPRFASLFADLGQSLPPTTRFVLDAAAWLRAGAAPLALMVTAAALAAATAGRSERGARRRDALFLAVPVLGAIRRAAASARAAAALADLLGCGVPVADALRHAARAAGSAEVGARTLQARERVLRGERLSGALAAARATTPAIARLVRAGEESGRTAQMLAYASRLERDRAARLTSRCVRVAEPAIILAFGGAVALVAAALLQALYGVHPA